MTDSKYKSFLVWGAIFLFIEVVLIFSYFIFSDKKIEVRDQLAQIFTTKASEKNNFPILKQNQAELALSAKSFISVFVANGSPASAKASADKLEKILIKKNEVWQLPIASITKLMTAVIACEKYKLDDVVMITEDSMRVGSLSGIYKVGDQFFFYNALRAMLIASHNEIANTFTEKTGTTSFIGSMNQKAAELGLLNTEFINVTGLDPKIATDPINHSTVYDIYKLARYITEDRPDIFYITTQKEFNLFNINKKIIGTIKNTNRLLDPVRSPIQLRSGIPLSGITSNGVEEQNIPFKIIGGKTGETDLAKQNLMIVAEAPCGGNIFSVVLGSQNRFEDMNKLLQYINNSYSWNCSEK